MGQHTLRIGIPLLHQDQPQGIVLIHHPLDTLLQSLPVNGEPHPQAVSYIAHAAVLTVLVSAVQIHLNHGKLPQSQGELPLSVFIHVILLLSFHYIILS